MRLGEEFRRGRGRRPRGQVMNEINRSPTFWRSFPIFEEFDKNTIAELADIATYRKWPAGTVIFQRGDEGNYMIVVISGRIKLSLITPQGRELMLRQHEAGAIFGEMAVLDGQTRSADATAMTAKLGSSTVGPDPFRASAEPSSGRAMLASVGAGGGLPVNSAARVSRTSRAWLSRFSTVIRLSSPSWSP